MNILIERGIIASAVMNFEKFMKDFSRTLNLKKSVMKNLKIITTVLDDRKAVKGTIFHNTDWGNLFMLYEKVKPKKVHFCIQRCEIEGATFYKPCVVDIENGIVDLEEVIVDKVDFIVTNSLNGRFDAHIENMLSQNLIDYVNTEWKWVIELGDVENEVS